MQASSVSLMVLEGQHVRRGGRPNLTGKTGFDEMLDTAKQLATQILNKI